MAVEPHEAASGATPQASVGTWEASLVTTLGQTAVTSTR